MKISSLENTYNKFENQVSQLNKEVSNHNWKVVKKIVAYQLFAPLITSITSVVSFGFGVNFIRNNNVAKVYFSAVGLANIVLPFYLLKKLGDSIFNDIEKTQDKVKTLTKSINDSGFFVKNSIQVNGYKQYFPGGITQGKLDSLSDTQERYKNLSYMDWLKSKLA
ncbi:MAG: hypothetical protein JXA94_00610 [Parachlamydiales bacterium]|nr:hypothetical protein [Parachlamydiales bacterium]